MKKSDIKVGESYAASRSNEYRYGRYESFTASKVTVLEEPFSAKGTRYPYKATTMVKVRHENGAEGTIATREIREPWGPYEADRDEHLKQKRAATIRSVELRRERGTLVRSLIESLQRAGVPASTERVYDRAQAMLAVKECGFTFEDEGQIILSAPYATALFKFWKNESPNIAIPAGDLQALLERGSR